MDREKLRTTALAWSCGLACLVGVVGGCTYDPVVQDAIDRLPSEDEVGPGELHRAGQPCVLCHSAYEGAEPDMAIGGTVYQDLTLAPVEGVFVTIYDSAGASQKACTNAAGNFYVERADWQDVRFPLTVQVGNRYMSSLIGRDRSCATCHQDRGIDRNSAGLVVVDKNTVPPEQLCGQNNAAEAGGDE